MNDAQTVIAAIARGDIDTAQRAFRTASTYKTRQGAEKSANEHAGSTPASASDGSHDR